ncbi:Na+/pantothenate symporter [Rhizobium sp. BK538]|nr:Na+/pantothenate symporter [Rhizobium sp. BK538]
MKNPDKRPFILNELKKPRIYITLLIYFLGMLIVFSFNPPEWLIILLVCGFGVLGQALITDKIYTSRWTRSEDETDSNLNRSEDMGDNDDHGQ